MNALSIIVPCYNEQKTITTLFSTIENNVGKIENIKTEYWFIDDGSSDNTLIEFQKLNANYPAKIHYISFSRNFGKEDALYAGLKSATGEYVVVMDADLQDPPELLPEMYETLQEGEYDCVGTKRINRRGEPVIRSFFANQFYKIINLISNTSIVNGARDYRMMTRQVVAAILSMNEYNRFQRVFLVGLVLTLNILNMKILNV